MSEERAAHPPMTMDAWLAVAASALGPGAPAVSRDERILLLDLARIAARRSDRTAAPITTFMAGIALAGLDGPARIERLRALVATLGQD